MSFTPLFPAMISSFAFQLQRSANAEGDLRIDLWSAIVSTGLPDALLDSSFNSAYVSGLPTSQTLAYQPFAFATGVQLAGNTKYVATVIASSVGAGEELLAGIAGNSTYDYGGSVYAVTSSGTFLANSNIDYFFELWAATIGSNTFTNNYPDDRKRSAKLVAAANSSIYLESPAGTMAEITVSRGAIDINLPIDLIGAYQKVFVVNGDNQKIIDFVNTRCYTTALGANPPDVGNALTGGTSGAAIVVDYATDIGATTSRIYGVPQNTAVFTDGETITGTDDDGNAISFVLNSALAATSVPHFYDWTVYGASATFGTFPTKPTLGCLYRGRMVLAGTPYDPHQWYMSRQGNPFDWNYVSADSQSPIAGNDADVGKVGDIILALIPRKDDFLIVGCANSMWVIRGDPAEGGSLDPITLSTGIFGPKSFCWDAEDNIYWFGSGGIYKLSTGGEDWGTVENLTAKSIPKLIDDETIDPTQHRITMGYDRIRHGILVCITKVVDNTNSAYWLDLRTGGIFPESYPANCAPISMMFYNADDDAYRKLLFGCADGYIRSFDDTAKVDDDGATDAAISAYVTLGPMPMNQDPELEGRMIGGFVTLAGGASGGAFDDTDGCQLNFYRGNDAETVLEDIKDGATAFNSVAFTGTGRKTKINTKVRGNYIAIKAQTIASNQTWSFEKFVANVKPVKGRVE